MDGLETVDRIKWTELSGQLENTVLGRKQCKQTLSFRNVRYYCVFGEHYTFE